MTVTPALTDPHILITLTILAAVTFFFAQGRFSIAIISVGMLVSLLATFRFYPLLDNSTGLHRLPSEKLLAGFSNPALITVVALLVVGEGVSRTGALAIVAQWIQKFSVGSWRLALALSITVVAIASAFLNNAPIVVIFLPILQTISADLKVSPSKMLMPLSFASILGGSCTLIGSSTNILLADYAAQAGIVQLNMFSFSQFGVILLIVGLIYLIFVAPKLLPDRGGDDDSTGEESGDHHAVPQRHRNYLAQMKISAESPLIGQRPADVEFLKNIRLCRVTRAKRSFVGVFKNVQIKEDDLLILDGTVRELKRAEWIAKSTLTPEIQGSRALLPEEVKEHALAEMIITPNSPFVGQTLEDIRFRNRFGPVVIGFQRYRSRKKEALERRITDIPLRGGDLLLLQGMPKQLAQLSERHEFFLFGGAGNMVINMAKARMAIMILLGIILLAMTPLADMLTLSCLGAFAMLATRCITWEQGYRAVPPEIILLIGSTLALGEAMRETGAAEVLAQEMVALSSGAPPWMILSFFGLLVMIFTNVISNNATAILFAPIGAGIAHMLSVNTLPFLMAVLFGANAAFASPIGYKTNLLVLKAGRYRFRDFFQTGLPLNVITWLLMSLLIPYFWPL
ncbi:SLC13 family permease [Magnetococcales bacterium HHB-1]